jgi:hypothetical protein
MYYFHEIAADSNRLVLRRSFFHSSILPTHRPLKPMRSSSSRAAAELLVAYSELALVYLVAALRQYPANLHHRPSNSNSGCFVSHISRIFAFRRNPIHGPGALFKGSE